MDSSVRYPKRRRKEPVTSVKQEGGLEQLLAAAARCNNVIVFSGSGLSASSGMSTFSTKGGLYERAQRKFGIQEGKKLFTYTFFEKQRLDALSFFADIYVEADRAVAGPSHRALAALADLGKLRRHYTLNIDGLAEAVGMDTWHPENNPTGMTVEMHGSIKQLVCAECGVVVPMSSALHRKLKGKRRIPCAACPCTSIRCRVMLYDDAEDDVITPENVFETMEADVKGADMVLWVGISFEQSASTQYFRSVRRFLAEAARLQAVTQAVVNPSDECLWNLLSSCSNTGDLEVLEVLSPSDEVLPLLAAAMAAGSPLQPALAAAAAQAAASAAKASHKQEEAQDDASAGAPKRRRSAPAAVPALRPKSAPASVDATAQLVDRRRSGAAASTSLLPPAPGAFTDSRRQAAKAEVPRRNGGAAPASAPSSPQGRTVEEAAAGAAVMAVEDALAVSLAVQRRPRSSQPARRPRTPDPFLRSTSAEAAGSSAVELPGGCLLYEASRHGGIAPVASTAHPPKPVDGLDLNSLPPSSPVAAGQAVQAIQQANDRVQVAEPMSASAEDAPSPLSSPLQPAELTTHDHGEVPMLLASCTASAMPAAEKHIPLADVGLQAAPAGVLDAASAVPLTTTTPPFEGM